MKVNMDRLEKGKAFLEVEVDGDTVEKALERAYRKVVRKVTVPGFRKGKTPRRILERFIGKAVLFEEALDFLVPEAYQNAVKETGIEPVDTPEVKLVKIPGEGEDGGSLKFTATVTVKPEVKLGPYKGIEVDKVPVKEVTEEDIDRQLEILRERNAQLVAVEGPGIEKDHYVILDVEAKHEGKPVKEASATGFYLVMGLSVFGPEFENHILGAMPGESRSFTVTYPEDFPVRVLAGKEIDFDVTIKEIKRKELPELNDEFARSVSDRSSLQELRTDLANRLKQSAENARRELLEGQALGKVVEGSEVEVPEPMIARRYEELLGELESRLKVRKLTLEQYAQMSGSTEEEIRAGLRNKALNQVKTDLVLDAIGKAEDIQISDEETEEEARALAGLYGQPVESVKETFFSGPGLDALKASMIRRKAIKLIADNAVETEKKEEAVDSPSEEED